MGLNTNLLVIKNIEKKDFVNHLFDLLKLNVLRTHKNLDWSQKASFLNQKQDSIAYAFINSTLYLECDYDIFLTEPILCFLQELGNEFDTFIYVNSDTVGVSDYWVFKNGKYFNRTFGMEEWDLSFLNEENLNEPEVEKDSCLIEDSELQNNLEAFIKDFDYDILFDCNFDVAEISFLK